LFLLMLRAEIRKVFTRGSAFGAIAVAFAVGLLAVGAMWEARSMQEGASITGAPIASLVTFSGVGAAGWALWMRNFFVLPLLLLLATAASTAGEMADRTLREDLVRPMPRWSVLAAKLGALCLLSAVTLVASLVPSLAAGAALFGLGEGEPGLHRLALGYAASFASDLGLFSLGLLASMFMRSVGGVVVAVVLVLLADRAAWGALKLAAMLGVGTAERVLPWTLVNAMGAWEDWAGAWEPARFAALALLVIVATAASLARFSRLDVP
jgi:hypothetical protein